MLLSPHHLHDFSPDPPSPVFHDASMDDAEDDLMSTTAANIVSSDADSDALPPLPTALELSPPAVKEDLFMLSLPILESVIPPDRLNPAHLQPGRLEVEHLTHLACKAGNTMPSSANGSPMAGSGLVTYLDAEVNRFRFVRTNLLKLALHAQVEVLRRHSVVEPTSANRLKYAMALTSLPEVDEPQQDESDRSSSPVPVDSPELHSTRFEQTAGATNATTATGGATTTSLQVQLPAPSSLLRTTSDSKRSSEGANSSISSNASISHARSASMESQSSCTSGASTPYTPYTPYTPFGFSTANSLAGSPLSVDVFTPHASSSASSSAASSFCSFPTAGGPPVLDLSFADGVLGSPAPSTRSFGFGWTCTSACANEVHLHGNTRKTRRRATM